MPPLLFGAMPGMNISIVLLERVSVLLPCLPILEAFSRLRELGARVAPTVIVLWPAGNCLEVLMMRARSNVLRDGRWCSVPRYCSWNHSVKAPS